MDGIYDMIIIGGGPAGYSAALYAARAGLSTLIIERMSIGGQMTLTGDIDNYPGFDSGIDGFTLGSKMQAGAERFGAETVYGEVLSVSLSGEVKEVVTDGGAFRARSVVIATGANPRPLGITGEEELVGRGVHYCAHCDGRFYKDKTVMVVGGGNSAAEDALYLARLCDRVILVHRRDKLRASRVLADAVLSNPKISFVPNAQVVGLVSEGGLSGVKITRENMEETLSASALFVSIGRAPASELFRGQLDIDGGGYIIAGEDTKTSLPGVFAAGDVRTKALRQVVTAAADGAVSAHFAEEYLSALDL